MTGRAAYLRFLKRQWPKRDPADYDEPGFYGMSLIRELDEEFPAMKEVAILDPVGRSEVTRLIFSPRPDSPYLFQTFIGGGAYVFVFRKSASFLSLDHDSCTNGQCTFCCTWLWNRGESGWIARNDIAHPVPLALLNKDDWVRAALPEYPPPVNPAHGLYAQSCVLL
jgi:hypothetical protein